MNIAFFSTKSYDRTYFDAEINESRHEITYYEGPLTVETTGLVDGFDTVCVFVNNQIDRPVIRKIAEYGIRVIALRSAGFNHVDLEAADEFGIKVVRVPAYSPEAVAEHTVALILTLNRKTHKAYNRVRENNFSLEGLTGFNLNKKTIGVIGTGAIGSAFCRIMTGFGCRVIAHDPVENDDLKKSGVRYLPLDKLLPISDIISLHCPLMPETKHMINRKAIDMMEQGVMLINTSRGALIDTSAVIEGLKKAKIGNLGIDVYEQEEHLFFRDLSNEVIQADEIARLMTFPNVLITGHQAFLTTEALREIARVTIDNLTIFENGDELVNVVRI